MCVDATRIYLGTRARTSVIKEPVVKGVQLENWLKEVLSILDTIAISCASATATPGGVVTNLVALGKALPPVIDQLRKSTSIFKSNKVFTE